MTAARADRFAALDGMRALACYAVLATHVGFQTGQSFGSGWIAPWISRLDVAVPIFFALSGFLLYRPFIRQAMTGGARLHFADFYRRRAVRVLPGYWLAIVVSLGLLTTRHTSTGDWLAYLSLTQTYNGHDVDPSLTQMWTLGVELSFYLVLPPLTLLARRRGDTPDRVLRRQCGLIAMLVAGTVLWDVCSFHFPVLGLSATTWLPGTIDWFAIGMFLAVLSCVPQDCTALRTVRGALHDWSQAPGLCWTVALALYWLITLPVGGPLGLEVPTAWQHISKNLVYGALVFFMMLPMTIGRGGTIGQVLSNPVARFLGRISYGVYLWHLPMLLLIQRAFNLPIFQGHYWEYLFLTLASATLLGTLSWYLVERPLLRRFSRSWRRPVPVVSTMRQIPATQRT